jgi:hypothetical protein
VPTDTFSYTGAEQTWTVPPGLTSVYWELWGAGTGSASPGGRVAGDLPVTGGETLRAYVGGTNSSDTGGFNGGGAGGNEDGFAVAQGGAGATDVRQGGSTLSDRQVVAGGGGGRGATDAQEFDHGQGGDGGADTGEDGQDASTDHSSATGGGGGTQSAGGSAGSPGDATDGSLGQGGDGADVQDTTPRGAGGGGGGGFYGGGGGGADATDRSPTDAVGAGGGAGPNLDDGFSTVTANERGTGMDGDGQAEVTYDTNNPENLTATSPDTPDTLDLDWDAASGDVETPNHFNVYRSTSAGVTTSDTLAGQTADGTTTTFTDTDLDENTEYFYAVTAVYTNGGEGDLSNEDSATTFIRAPTDLAVDAINGDQFDVSFRDQSSGKDGYRLYRRPDGYVELTGSEFATFPHSDADLSGETSFTVAAVLNLDSTGFSDQHIVYLGSTEVVLEVDSNWRIEFQDGSTVHTAESSATTGEVVRLVAAYDGSNLELYVDDATTAAGSTAASTAVADNSGENAIGADSSGNGKFEGDLHRVAIDDVYWDEAARQRWMDDGSVDDPLVQYEFFEGGGITLEDVSGNDADATWNISSPGYVGGGSWTQDDGDIAAEWGLDFDDSSEELKWDSDGHRKAWESREMTISFMLNPQAINNSGNYRNIIQFFQSADSQSRFERNSDTNDGLDWIVPRDGGTSNQAAVRSIPYSVGETFRVTLVVDYPVNGETRGYKDGTLVDTRADPGDTQDASGGFDRVKVWPQQSWLDFAIDDYREYDRVLSDSEISDLADGKDITDGLITHFKLDEGSGTTPTNSGSFMEGDYSLDYDGTDDRSEATDAGIDLTTNNEFTIAQRVRPDSLGGSLFNYRPNFIVDLATGGALRVVVESDWDDTTLSDGTIPVGEETPYAVTYDGSDLRIYIDGQLDKTFTGNWTLSSPSGNDVVFAHRVTGSGDIWFDGIQDDTKFYNRQLSDSEVQDLADGTDVTGGKVGEWLSNSGSGSTMTDSAGSNDATIDGATWVENTPDGTINGAEYTRALTPIEYTTTNLLDGERYVLQARAFVSGGGEAP